MNLPLTQPIAIVDVETTGGSPLGHRIIEIGIVRLEPGREPVSFTSLVNPHHFVSHFIYQLTGIRPDDLQGAPDFEDIAGRVDELLQDAVFVAHNARFDYSFVKNEFMRLGQNFSAKTVCSARLSKALYPEHRKHNLDSLIERHGLSMANRHRALDDAQAVLDFFVRACEDRGEPAFAAAFERLHAGKRLVQCDIPIETLKALPEAPGVYLFYGEKNEVLYVGKAKNLKERVLTHLHEDHQNGKTLSLAEKARDVETRRTAGELSALLLESELIKTLKPIFNRHLKGQKQYIVLTRRPNADGYYTIEMEAVAAIDDSREIVGIFPSVRKAKEVLLDTAHEYRLCAKILGLEKAAGPCFSYHLKNCKGACVREEASHAYNARFVEAFGTPVISRWPYAGAVLVEEFDESRKKGSAYIVENWKLTGRIDYSEETETSSAIERPFDFDVYKILKRTFSRPSPRLVIRPIPADPRADLRYEPDSA